MIIETVIEVLRGGKPGDRHWVPLPQWLDGESFSSLVPYTSCGLPATAIAMVSDHIEDPRRLTCLECRLAFAADYLANKG